MRSQEVLDIVMQHSETMVTEWADSQDGYGVEVIREAINVAMLPNTENTQEDKRELELLIQNVRTFILMDMTIVGW